MAKVLTDGKTKIGAYRFPDRKSPVCVSKKETALLSTGTSTHLKAQKNL